MNAPMRQNSGASRPGQPGQRRRRRPDGAGRPAGRSSDRQQDAFVNPSTIHDPAAVRTAPAAGQMDDDDVEDLSHLETDFATLGVPAILIKALADDGVTGAFPIQSSTLPDSMAGRDLLGRGRTGSGKTIAFSLPLVTRLAASSRRRQPGRPRALVLVPTRELANQVAATIAPLAHATNMRITTIYGGVGQGNQVAALRNGVDIVIACPGRLEDLIGQRHCHLDAVEITVLDEADHMADLGFLPGVKRILDATPVGGQRMLFSATLDHAVDALVKRYLVNPVVHSVDPAVAPVSTMTHHVLATQLGDKLDVITAIAGGKERSLLFTRTKHGAKKLAKQLSTAGIPAVELHGNLSQAARERNLSSFSAGSTRVLVATDIAARGIHVDEVALVVHVDPPAEHKAYLHRSGRTARAGASGVVVTLMTPDQVSDVRALARAASIQPTITKVDAAHPLLGELAGPPAARVKMAAPAPAPVQQSRRPGNGGGGNGGGGRSSGNGRPSNGGSRNAAPGGARTAAPSGAPRRAGGRPGAGSGRPGASAGTGGAARRGRRG
jgi:superfamily II DNA/RNA helicase